MVVNFESDLLGVLLVRGCSTAAINAVATGRETWHLNRLLVPVIFLIKNVLSELLYQYKLMHRRMP